MARVLEENSMAEVAENNQEPMLEVIFEIGKNAEEILEFCLLEDWVVVATLSTTLSFCVYKHSSSTKWDLHCVDLLQHRYSEMNTGEAVWEVPPERRDTIVILKRRYQVGKEDWVAGYAFEETYSDRMALRPLLISFEFRETLGGLCLPFRSSNFGKATPIGVDRDSELFSTIRASRQPALLPQPGGEAVLCLREG